MPATTINTTTSQTSNYPWGSESVQGHCELNLINQKIFTIEKPKIIIQEASSNITTDIENFTSMIKEDIEAN